MRIKSITYLMLVCLNLAAIASSESLFSQMPSAVVGNYQYQVVAKNGRLLSQHQGKVYFSQPAKLLLLPKKHSAPIILLNNQVLTLIDPELEQYNKVKLTQQNVFNPFFILTMPREKLQLYFKIIVDNNVLNLIPLQKSGQIKQIKLSYASSSQVDLRWPRQLQVKNQADTVTTLNFYHISYPKFIPSKVFRLTPPRNYDYIGVQP